MSDLTLREKSQLEKIFGMKEGYVLDFSNNSFQYFVAESININIYEDEGYTEYSSKANKLRQIWREEPDHVVGKLIHDLLDKIYDDTPGEAFEGHYDWGHYIPSELEELFSFCRNTEKRLLLGDSIIEFPDVDDVNLNIILSDIKTSLNDDTPELVLDRLHTFTTRFLRNVCSKYKIETKNNAGVNLPIHSLMGMLKGYYIENDIIDSTFTIEALKINISLIDKYNNVRNNESFAHDNDVMNKIEAKYAVKTITNLLILIDEIEKYIDSCVEISEDMPF